MVDYTSVARDRRVNALNTLRTRKLDVPAADISGMSLRASEALLLQRKMLFTSCRL